MNDIQAVIKILAQHNDRCLSNVANRNWEQGSGAKYVQITINLIAA